MWNLDELILDLFEAIKVREATQTDPESPIFSSRLFSAFRLPMSSANFSDSNVGGPVMPGNIPPPPPPPPPSRSAPRSWRERQREKVNDWRSPSSKAEDNSPKEFRVLVNGTQVPQAIASAFKDPRKDKRPFSYFTSGQAPDLSEKPSPSSVRRTNPYTSGGPVIPKVLPIVSENELEAEEAKTMPYSHLQYNSPLNLYSKTNVDEAIQQQTGAYPLSPGKNPKFNIQDSATYKMIHEMDSGRDTQPSPARQSATYFDPPVFRVKQEDYPHYEGFVNPNLQSPSFKKLQQSTIGSSLAEDDHPVRSGTQSALTESRASDHWETSQRFTGIDRHDINPSPAFHNIQKLTGDFSYLPGEFHAPAKAEMFSPDQGSRHPPHWAMTDPVAEEDRDHTLDPNFAAQIAEAERPKVPPQTVPEWARSAAHKQNHWQRSTGISPDEQQRKHYAAGAEVEASWSRASHRHQDKWDAHYGQFQPAPAPVYQPLPQHYQQAAQSPPQQYQQAAQSPPQQYQQAAQSPPQQYQQAAQSLPQQYQQAAQSLPQQYQQAAQSLPQQYQHVPQHYQPTPQPYQSATLPDRRRARSNEPPEWRAGRQSRPARQMYTSQTTARQKESWLKPFVAPNIDALATGPRTSGPRLESRSDRHDERYSSSAPHGGLLTFGSYYGPERGGFYGARPRGYGRSLSSSSYRGSQYSQSAQTGGAIYRPQEFGGRDYYTLPAPKKQITVASLVSGQAEKPGPVDQVVPAWQQTAEQKRQLYESGRVASLERPQPQEPAPNWAQTAQQKRNLWEVHSTKIDPYVNRAPVGPEPPPTWARRADQTRSLWEHEADAMKQQGSMEMELSRRSQQQYHSAQSRAPVIDTWKAAKFSLLHRDEKKSHVVPTEHDLINLPNTSSAHCYAPTSAGAYTAVSTVEGAKPLWQQAEGASTKSQVSGIYKDPYGHNVTYVKELYTTSDPGKEFSMQTEEEKKVLEEPLQPGVISRHSTTKYYKRSTFNSTTTASTTQTPPTVGFSPMPRSLEPPRPGPVGMGITQF